MFTDSTQSDLLNTEESSGVRKLVAAVCAIVVTALVLAGYTYLRKRHTERMIAPSQQPQQALRNVPKGPPKAHILVDDALLKAGQTIIGGTVRNTSPEKLTGLTVGLELKRKKDALIEQTSVSVEPTELEPAQEGRYMLRLPAQQYTSVRLVGLKGGSDSTLLAITTAQGQKRPPERLEPRVVMAPRARSGEFLNSPDKPARVP